MVGLGVEKDERKAFGYYLEAARKGHAVSPNNIGTMYRDGKGTAKNLEEAFKWFKASAEQGHAGAQNNLTLLSAV